MPDISGAVNLGEAKITPEQEEQLRRMAAEHPEDTEQSATKVITAFTVVMLPSGEVTVVAYEGDDFEADLTPTADLVYGMAATIQKDIAASDTARATLEVQMQQAKAMQERMEAAALQQRLQAEQGGLRRG